MLLTVAIQTPRNSFTGGFSAQQFVTLTKVRRSNKINE